VGGPANWHAIHRCMCAGSSQVRWEWANVICIVRRLQTVLSAYLTKLQTQGANVGKADGLHTPLCVCTCLLLAPLYALCVSDLTKWCTA